MDLCRDHPWCRPWGSSTFAVTHQQEGIEGKGSRARKLRQLAGPGALERRFCSRGVDQGKYFFNAWPLGDGNGNAAQGSKTLGDPRR